MSGYLLNGQWHEGWYDTQASNGEFIRTESAFRNWITTDGFGNYPAEAGRYCLYVYLACPWAHRTLIARSVKKLESIVSVSIVEPVMSDQGWAFSSSLPDDENGFLYVHQMYWRQCFKKIRGIVLMQRCINNAGSYRIKANTLLGVFTGKTSRDSINAALGNHRNRSVYARKRIFNDGGRDADDAASRFLGQHLFSHKLGRILPVDKDN